MELSLKKIKTLIDKESISKRIRELANDINSYYKDEEVLVVCILKGAFMFLSDLVRELDIDIEIDFMIISSYGNNTKSSGEIRIIKDLQKSIKNKNILIVEDIVDTGYTLDHLLKYLHSREPKDIRICTFLNKKCRRAVNIDIDFSAFEIGDEFVIGYGLDYAQRYRQLPFLGVLIDG